MFTGDPRANKIPPLSSNHILFPREHNYIAESLADINPHWDSNRVFEETRKIIIDIMQKTIYDEFIPATISPATIQEFDLKGETKSYDDNIDSTTTTVHKRIAEITISSSRWVLILSTF